MFGLEISRAGLSSAIRACRDRLAQGRGGYVCFVNVHTLTESTRDAALRCALASATYRFADGRPLLWLSRLEGEPIEGRVAGPDFMAEMLRVESGRVHGLIGGSAARCAKLGAAFEIATIVHSPPMRAFSPEHAFADWEAFLATCPGRRPPAIVWVGLGAPKQERWMATISPHAPGTLFLGVGAAFDFLSGTTRRAPSWVQSAGLEWAHRLANDPRRLWKRYLVTNTRFLARAVQELRTQRSASRNDGAT